MKVLMSRARWQVRPTCAHLWHHNRLRVKLLIWDNAPPHHPKLVREAAERAQITITWLPFLLASVCIDVASSVQSLSGYRLRGIWMRRTSPPCSTCSVLALATS